MAKVNTKRGFHTRDIVLCALFSAILCAVSPFTLPIGPVPLSLCNFAVMVAGCILGALRGSVSVAVFVALGALGLPVFGGGAGGFGHILAPTGGFILSYVPMAALSGFLSSLGRGRKYGFWITLAGCFLSVHLGYIIGAAWFALAAGVPISVELLVVCVLPFVPFDAAKCVLAAMLSRLISTRLRMVSGKKSPKSEKNQGI